CEAEGKSTTVWSPALLALLLTHPGKGTVQTRALILCGLQDLCTCCSVLHRGIPIASTRLTLFQALGLKLDLFSFFCPLPQAAGWVRDPSRLRQTLGFPEHSPEHAGESPFLRARPCPAYGRCPGEGSRLGREDLSLGSQASWLCVQQRGGGG
ncbi:unnamed protein product, partial [Gulo gulo]